MNKFTFLFGLLWISYGAVCQSLTADQIIQKSIEYHDPTGNWGLFDDVLEINQESPNHTGRTRTVRLNRAKGTFSFLGEYPDGKLKYEVENNQGLSYWNDSNIFPDSIASKYRINNERALMYRNYYDYLYGGPMKLLDPGTNVHSDVKEVQFYGSDYYKISVTYDQEVGSDTWYFYFDKDNFSLGAYEFWKEKPGDGEYLLLEGMVELGGIKMPERIKWFMTEGERWLGTDILSPKFDSK